MKSNTSLYNRKTQENEKVSDKVSWFYDLYIELLGSLIPGILPVIFIGGLVAFTLDAGISMFKKSFNSEMFMTNKFINTVLANNILLVGTILVLSYVLGVSFFRRDPKEPDALSARKIWDEKSKHNNEDLRGLAAQYDEKGKFDSQFPYWYLKCYLHYRGLKHLLQYVPWCPNKKASKKNRTKMFVNTIKLRLQLYAPQLTKNIIRNEAHARLSTSVWYAAVYIRKSALLVGILGAFLLLIGRFIKTPYSFEVHGKLVISIILCAMVSALGHFMANQVINFIHYIRVREVVFVLETVHSAQQKYGIDFSDLCKPEEELGNCEKCGKDK